MQIVQIDRHDLPPKSLTIRQRGDRVGLMVAIDQFAGLVNRKPTSSPIPNHEEHRKDQKEDESADDGVQSETDDARDYHDCDAAADEGAFFCAPAPTNCQRELRGGECLLTAVRQSLDDLPQGEVAKTITFFLNQHELITALTTASAVAVLLIVPAFWTTHRIVPPFAGFPAAGLEP
ncbi:MAG: hypothetical protein P9F75_09120 [Candidatus Contendobacter sp.]|nr:hypothetical protein [Candidatus Contendobacter sp.]